MNLLIVAALVAPLLYFWNKLAPSLPPSGSSLPGAIPGSAKKRKAKKTKKSAASIDTQEPRVLPAGLQTSSLGKVTSPEVPPTDDSKENSTPSSTPDISDSRKPKLSQKQAKKLLRQQRQERRDSKQKARIDETPEVSDGPEVPAKVPAPVTDAARSAADHGMVTDSEEEREPARVLRVKGPDETLSLTEMEESDGWQVVDVHASGYPVGSHHTLHIHLTSAPALQKNHQNPPPSASSPHPPPRPRPAQQPLPRPPPPLPH